MVERVVLIGFMCSGKTTVGRLLAERLAWDFVDFDEMIERAEQRSIAQIFREHGETHFRRLEAELTEQVARRKHVVLVPGGGWVTQPDLVDRLRPSSLMVWLRVRPETVYRRHRRQGNVERPLLAGDDPAEQIRALLAARTPLYRQADLAVDTDDRRPADVAAEVVSALQPRPAGPGDRRS